MRVITFKTPDIMVPLLRSLKIPILEYGNDTWCPYTVELGYNEIDGTEPKSSVYHYH